MIVDRIEPLALAIPGATKTLSLVLCRVTTRSGVQGWGECLCNRPPLQQSLVATIRDALAPLYVGKSVDDRGALNLDARRRFASFGRSGTVPNALAAIDIALWDIAAKAAGRPLSALLGGARSARVPVMASLDKYDDGPRVAARLEQALAAGVAAAKVHEAKLEVIEAARKVVPAAVPFVADLNNAHPLDVIVRDKARWQALDLLWLEDPLWPPEVLLGDASLAGLTIGLGADLGTVEQLALYAKAPSVGVLQPDVCMLGGVTEAARVAQALAGWPGAVALHTPFVGPAALASLHLIALADKPAYFATVEAEDAMDPYGAGFTRWQPSIEVPTGAGLGFNPDPAWVARHALSPLA